MRLRSDWRVWLRGARERVRDVEGKREAVLRDAMLASRSDEWLNL